MSNHRPWPIVAWWAVTLFCGAVTAATALPPSPPRPSSLPPAVVEALVPRLSPLLDDGEPALQRRRLAGEKAPDALHAVVLLCEFADSVFYGHEVPDKPTSTQSDFYFAAHDSLYYAYQFQDVADYFTAASGGAFSLDVTVLGTPLALPEPMAWYGDHPDQGEQSYLLARDAVALADPLVDFSRFDTVILIHAGAGEETDILGDSPEQIYSSYLGPADFVRAAADSVLPDPWLATADTTTGGDPVRLRHVLILPENEFQDPVAGYGGYFGSLGVYCFEVGLRLGMLSLSDFTPPGHPDSQGIGEFGLMGYGLFVGAGYIPDLPCAFNRMLMGWERPLELDPATGTTCELRPVLAGGDSTLARVTIGPSEYWLLEYRLQDPDGNGIFSFPGDLNGNNIPDFYDADSAFGDGTPTGFFDPATDTRERLLGGEFDFFMSENQARAPGVKGAGSGLYVWHVDEGVIRSVFGSESNLFNADPARKAVDLEEADGIQDLDRRVGTPYVLGGDDDSFRGEDNAVFGPDTDPATTTAGGARTGVLIDAISHVVVDSTATAPDGEGTVIRYAAHMSFHCGRTGDVPGGPVVAARRTLDGVDLGGSHLTAADLDGDGTLEILACADGGRLYAWHADLAGWLPAHPDGLLATGVTATGGAPRWHPPAAVADLEWDGRSEVFVTADDGLYAFRSDTGAEVADGDLDPVSVGLLVPAASCRWPAIVTREPPRVVLVEDLPTGGIRLLWRDAVTGLVTIRPLPEEADRSVAPPVVWGDRIVVPALGPDGASGGLGILDLAEDTVTWWPLPAAPLPWRPVLSSVRFLVLPDKVADDFSGRREALLLLLVDGRAVLVGPMGDTADLAWRSDLWPDSAVAPGMAWFADGRLVVGTPGGVPARGWPVVPRATLRPGWRSAAPEVLSARWDGAMDANLFVFPARDGRLFLLDGSGATLPGSPLAGPGECAGTPVLADLDEDGRLELAAAGAFTRLTGAGPDTLEGAPVSAVTVWDLPWDGEPVWAMWGGDARNALPGAVAGPAQVETGLLLHPGSLLVYPTPVVGSDMIVRFRVGTPCRAAVDLYSLEGELVRHVPAVDLPQAGPAEVTVPVGSVAPGMYLCRVTATTGSRREADVVPVAIAR